MDKKIPNIRGKIIKLIRIIGIIFPDLGLDSGFLDMTPKAQVTMEKIEKLNFLKIKNSYFLKDTIKKVKDNP